MADAQQADVPIAVSAGTSQSCVLLAGGDVDCWGYSRDYTPETDGYLGPALAVASGGFDTCTLVAGGSVYCWGEHDFESVVSNYTAQSPGYAGPATAVSVGGIHQCVLLAGGNVRCWGNNLYGQSADYTPLTPGYLGPATAVSAGSLHTCVLVAGGNVHCWGSNSSGQAQAYTPASPGYLGPAISVAAGNWFTCVLLASGGVHCWGYGQASGPAAIYPNPVLALSADTVLCVLLASGDIHCGYPDTEVPEARSGDFVAMDAGHDHACGLQRDGDVDCWFTSSTDASWGQEEERDGGLACGGGLGARCTYPSPSMGPIQDGGAVDCSSLDPGAPGGGALGNAQWFVQEGAHLACKLGGSLQDALLQHGGDVAWKVGTVADGAAALVGLEETEATASAYREAITQVGLSQAHDSCGALLGGTHPQCGADPAVPQAQSCPNGLAVPNPVGGGLAGNTLDNLNGALQATCILATSVAAGTPAPGEATAFKDEAQETLLGVDADLLAFRDAALGAACTFLAGDSACI